jgi:F-type H+-transporting ATPase subunit delta
MPLSDDQREKVIARLEKRSSLSVRLEEKVDPSVIGGAVVIMAGQIIDGSIRYGLNRIKEQLTRVRVH